MMGGNASVDRHFLFLSSSITFMQCQVFGLNFDTPPTASHSNLPS